MFRFPTTSQHTSIIGRNGSGKTQCGAWLLSHAPFDVIPYIIIDFKHDELLNSIDKAQEITNWQLPKKPGLYILHPLPSEQEKLEAFLWQIWAHENIGVYIDEGYMIDKRSPALQALLTQGRSKNIPLTILTQRPSYCSRFIFSEATFFYIFHLNDKRDKDIIRGMAPMPADEKLAQYHAWWYDVGKDNFYTLQPVPNGDTILERFDARLEARRKFI